MLTRKNLNSQLTQIAELEAERNEDLTVASGALQGEKRAALTRVCVVILFFLAAELAPRLHGHAPGLDPARIATMLCYLVFAAACWYAATGSVRGQARALALAPLLMVIDFAFIGVMGTVELVHDATFNQPLTVAFEIVVITFTIVRTHLWHVAAAVVLAIAVYTGLAAADGRYSLESVAYVDAGFVGVGIIVALTNRAVRTMFQELRHRDNLSRFLPQQVAEKLLAIGPSALAPVQREVTVLFADIRDFTRLSEGLEPRALLQLLDTYYGVMTQVIKGHDGVVGKYIGDGILAFWNVPDADPMHAIKAVRAARDMLRALAEYNQDRERVSLPALRVGIGIHTGTVAAGMLGARGQAEYTVIGDAVNVASRVEGLTKTMGTPILVTESTRNGCGQQATLVHVAREEIRGRTEPVTLYKIADEEP